MTRLCNLPTKTKAQRERKARLKREGEVRSKNVSDFFLQHSTWFRPWLHEVTRSYKERGVYPLMACWLLPSYYTDDMDREVAAFASMLIRDRAYPDHHGKEGIDGVKLMERVAEFRELLGEKPSEWFLGRRFVGLSVGEKQTKRTGGVMNAKIAEYFSLLYDGWAKRETCFWRIFDDYFEGETGENRARVLRLVLGASDGFGMGLWATMPPEPKCPFTGGVMDMLRTFFPDYKRLGDKDAAVRLFGFERDSDFFYATLAYEELQGRKPKECKRLATVYQKRYNDGVFRTSKCWIGKRDGILNFGYDTL